MTVCLRDFVTRKHGEKIWQLKSRTEAPLKGLDIATIKCLCHSDTALIVMGIPGFGVLELEVYLNVFHIGLSR